MKAIILAAGLGSRLRPLTDEVPKCMVPVAGVPIIDRMLVRLREAGLTDVIVVTGYLHSVLAEHLASSDMAIARDAVLIENEHYHDWGNFYSLLVAKDAACGDSFIKLDGDVLLDDGVLPALMQARGPGVLAVDSSAALAEEEMKARVDDSGLVVELSKTMSTAVAVGESIGVERIDRELAPHVFDKLDEVINRGETHEYYERAYQLLMDEGHQFRVADISHCRWSEIDDVADLEAAAALV